MKIKILLIIISLLTTNFLLGQTKTKFLLDRTKEEVKMIKQVVLDSIKADKEKKNEMPTLVAEYDFDKQIYVGDVLKPKHNQPVVLKIININRLANNVVFTTNDIKIANNIDIEEEQVKKVIGENRTNEPITGQILNTEVAVTSEAEKKVKVPEEKEDFINGLNNRLKQLNASKFTKETKLNESLKTVYEKQTALQNAKDNLEGGNKILDSTTEDAKKEINNSLPLLRAKLDEAKASLIEAERKKDSIRDIIDGINFEKNQIQKQLDIYGNLSENLINRTKELLLIYNNIQNCLIDINRINAAYNSYIDFVINPNLTAKQYAKDASEICVILDFDKTINYHLYIKTFEKTYRAFLTQYNDTFNGDLFFEIAKNDKTYADLVKLKFDNLKKEVENINTLVNTVELRKKLNNVEIINHFLSNENAFTIVSNPIQPLEDYIEINAKISQINDLGTSIIKQNPKNFIYREYIRQGVRWDLSVGTVFDFGIKNQQYEIKTITANTYKIVENNTSDYTPTIAALLHTSFRSNSMFAFGFTLGASIDITKLNLNSFFPGISLLIGKKEKIIFTVGPSFKKVKQIKSIYDTESIYTQQIQAEDVTNEQFRIGGFFGISYNLTNKQKSKIKIAN